MQMNNMCCYVFLHVMTLHCMVLIKELMRRVCFAVKACVCYAMRMCVCMCICGQDMVQVVSIDHKNTAVSPVDSLKQLRERMREEREETMKLIHASECT